MNVTEALNSLYLPCFQAATTGKETILAILEAANRTPSWANTQPWEIFVARREAPAARAGRHLEPHPPLQPHLQALLFDLGR